MTNQSIIAVPANVEDPRVLQRFLSLLVEKIDVVVGNRSGVTEGYASQQQLIDAAAVLLGQLEAAQTDVGQALSRLSALDRLVVEDLAEQLNAIDEKNAEQDDKLTTLGAVTAIKGALLSFEGNGVNNPSIQTSFNVDATASRISVGLYEFSLVQVTFEGIDVLTNSTRTLTWAIQPTVTSAAFNVVYTTAAPGKLRIQVSTVTLGAGSQLVLTPYDLKSGDRVDASMLFTVPGATLPGGL
jgi:hypothetical protein